MICYEDISYAWGILLGHNHPSWYIGDCLVEPKRMDKKTISLGLLSGLNWGLGVKVYCGAWYLGLS
jgi:hypothetical protein